MLHGDLLQMPICCGDDPIKVNASIDEIAETMYHHFLFILSWTVWPSKITFLTEKYVVIYVFAKSDQFYLNQFLMAIIL